MSFAVPRALPLSLLAALVLAGCAEKGAAPLKKGEKPVDVASVVRQKMPASVKDRNAWADALAKTFESQKIAPTEENICSVLAVAQQESMYQSDPVVPGLNKIAWKEIDRRAESMHIPVFLVHTALKITSPNGKSYSERLDTVKTEKQLSAIFDDFIGRIRTLPVAFHHLRPFHAQFTRFAGGNFIIVIIDQLLYDGFRFIAPLIFPVSGVACAVRCAKFLQYGCKCSMVVIVIKSYHFLHTPVQLEKASNKMVSVTSFLPFQHPSATINIYHAHFSKTFYRIPLSTHVFQIQMI